MELPFWAKISLTFIGVTIAAGNGTVFIVYFSNRQLRTVTNYFVLSLAVSDFLVGTILLPLQVWFPTSEALGPLIAFILIASLSNISGCTYDRYIAIHNPLRYQSIVTKAKVYKIISTIWLIPVIVAVVPQIWLRPVFGIDPDGVMMAQRVYVALMSFGVLITCLVLTGIYISIFCVAKRHFDAIAYLNSLAQPRARQDENGSRPNMKSRRFSLKSLVKDVKATKLVAMIGAAFVICWLPLIVINIFDSLGYSRLLPLDFVRIALFTIFCNSLGNPIIYAFFQQEFRTTVRTFIRKLFKKKDGSHFRVTLSKSSTGQDEVTCSMVQRTPEDTDNIKLNNLHKNEPLQREDGANQGKHHSVVSFIGCNG